MEDAQLYHNSNSVQRQDATEILEKYKNIKWKSNASILDVGCGDGSVTMTVLKKYLPSDFRKLVGCDVSEIMLKFASEAYKDERTDFMQLDIEGDLPEGTIRRFDHVFSNYTLHWVNNHIRAFQNIYDLMANEGNCLLIILSSHPAFDAYRIMSKREKWSKFIHDVECIISPYHDLEDPESQITGIMEEIGYKDIDVKYVKKTYTYGMEFMRFLQSANFFKIPSDVYDDYLEELLQVFREINIIDQNYENLKFDYDLLVVYGSK